MSRVHPFYQLFWRWSALLMIATFAALLALPVFLHLRSISFFFWLDALLVPAAIGLIVASQTSMVRKYANAWMLPSLRRTFYRGTWQILIATVAVITLATAALHQSALVAAGIAALAFAVSVATVSGMRWLGALALGVMFSIPLLDTSRYVELVAKFALPLSFCCMVVAWWLMHMQRDPDVQRREIFTMLNRLTHEPAQWQVRIGLEPDMHGVISDRYRKRSWFGWITSALDADSSSRGASLTGVMWQTALYGLISFESSWALWLALPLFVAPGLTWNNGLSLQLLYPVHRRTRAVVTMAFQIIGIAASCLIVAIMFTLLNTFHPFDIEPGTSLSVRYFGAAIACLMIWLPVGIWPRSAPAANRPASVILRVKLLGIGKYIVHACVYMAATVFSLRLYVRLLGHIDRIYLIAFMSACAVVTNAIFLLLLRRSYYREDLV